MTASQASSDVSESGASCRTPAFRTSASRPPSTSTASRTDRGDRVGIADVGADEGRAGAAGDASPRRRVPPGEDDRARPRRASRSTIAAPMPEVPPVTSARIRRGEASGARLSHGAPEDRGPL